jgi:hypothetical protein
MASPYIVALSAGSPSLQCWPAKDPVDQVIYGADFVSLIPSGAAISTVTVAISTTGAVSATDPAATISGTVVTIELRGGVDNELALVIFTATLSDGEIIRRSVLLPVFLCGPLTSGGGGGTPSDDLLLESGGYLLMTDGLRIELQ